MTQPNAADRSTDTEMANPQQTMAYTGGGLMLIPLISHAAAGAGDLGIAAAATITAGLALLGYVGAKNAGGD